MRVGAPNGALWSAAPNGTRCTYAPSLPMDQGQQFAETIGYESSRTEDTCRIGIGPRSISIILLLYYLVIPRRGDIILAFRTAPREPLAIVAYTGPSDGTTNIVSNQHGTEQ